MNWTIEEAMEFAEIVFGSTTQLIESQSREVAPMSLILHEHPEQPGNLVWSPVIPDPEMFDSEEGKNDFADQVRSASMELGGDFVFLLTECWVKESTENPSRLVEQYGSVEAIPGRQEALMLKVDGLGGFSATIRGIITDEGGQRRVAKPVTSRTDQGGSVHSDRFSDLSGRQLDN